MTEYGIFTDEGCIEADLWNREEAVIARQIYLTEDLDATPGDYAIRVLCQEHRDAEAPKDACDECANEYGE